MCLSYFLFSFSLFVYNVFALASFNFKVTLQYQSIYIEYAMHMQIVLLFQTLIFLCLMLESNAIDDINNCCDIHA